MVLIVILCSAAVLALLVAGLRIVRQGERGLVETLGRATGYLKPGLHWRVPALQRVVRVGFRAQHFQLGMLAVVTSDNVSAWADADITVRLRDSAEAVRAAYYNPDSHLNRVVSLAQTALLDSIGDTPFSALIMSRRDIGDRLFRTLAGGAGKLGVELLQADLKEIELSEDVRETIHAAVLTSFEYQAHQ